MPKLRFAMVCASNMNRSMEAHHTLQKKKLYVSALLLVPPLAAAAVLHALQRMHFESGACWSACFEPPHPTHPYTHTGTPQVRSYGVGQHVKLPGASKDSPNVYAFGTPYKNIYEDLKGKDPALYARNGLLAMLERNIATKAAPERWQHER
jgi:hypothetical protein